MCVGRLELLTSRGRPSTAIDELSRPIMMIAFLICQLYVVLFVALHDWLPLGKLNNRAGIRAVDTKTQRLRTTALSTLPFAIGLVGSAHYLTTQFPMWLMWLLWITYGAALYGILRAWYLPYLVYNDPVRATRYKQRFADTHAFLPARNGIRPDTLHVTFHAVVLVLIALLFGLTFYGPLTRR